MTTSNSVVMPIKCTKNKRDFYLRYDKAFDGQWVLSQGVVTRPQDIIANQQNESVKVDLMNSRTGPQYKCPYCGNRNFVRCGKCHNLTCYNHGSQLFSCAHCGNSGKVTGHIDRLDGKSINGQ